MVKFNNLLDEIVEQLLIIRDIKPFTVVYPEEVLATYADFTIDRVGVYRDLRSLPEAERELYNQYKSQIPEDSFHLFESLFAGICFPAKNGWVFHVHSDSVVKLYGKNKGEELFYKVITFDDKVGFDEGTPEEEAAIRQPIGDSVGGYDGDDFSTAVEEIYLNKLRANNETKFN